MDNYSDLKIKVKIGVIVDKNCTHFMTWEVYGVRTLPIFRNIQDFEDVMKYMRKNNGCKCDGYSFSFVDINELIYVLEMDRSSPIPAYYSIKKHKFMRFLKWGGRLDLKTTTTNEIRDDLIKEEYLIKQALNRMDRHDRINKKLNSKGKIFASLEHDEPMFEEEIEIIKNKDNEND